MSSEVIFVSEVSHAIDLKAEQMTSDTNFDCKAIEVTEVNSKKSIPRSQVVRIIDGDDELKNIAGRIPEATPSIKTSLRKP